MGSEVRIGLSGWRYAPWRGDFYPEGLIQRKELAYASRAVNSIEINGSFYALQTPERYAQWAQQTPDGFVFSVKAPRFITHVKRLRDIEEPLANFFASGVLALRRKLGPILWQFPPSFKFDETLFDEFLRQLPHTSNAAKRLAKHSQERLHKEGYLESTAGLAMRHAVEIRNDSFLSPAFIDLLRRHGVALVVADTAGKWPCIEDLTGDFVYLRLHGDKKLYSSGYSEKALKRWRERIDLWRQGKQPDDARLVQHKAGRRRRSRDVFCYFDNDIKVRAPYDAYRLLQMLDLAGQLSVTPGRLPDDDSMLS
ncbi:DUF72 domain-containing protein [Pseudomonas sp. B11(2017)]|uniref:DUF72 domain-containing protein n=1 Tax=Pseudomonas sp. B11(2017) TaxID=1981748 RepID=UPI000A1D6E44|nr:DUF72 domain-containing protein [Pseudomonas sp. B11(2017)]